MQITIATILTAIAAVSAAPTSHKAPRDDTPLSFTMMALRSASPIHFGRIDASGTKFYIGTSPSSYCPTPPVQPEACPSGNSTSVVFGPNGGGASLNVMVPGGQQIYIAPDGSLSYTQAHSAFIPPGSITEGFTLGEEQSNTLRTISHSKGGFFACPVTANTGPWKIFVGAVNNTVVPSGCADDCLGFNNNAIEFTAESYGAWQY